MLPAIHGGLMAQRLEPGDTVYVPERLVYMTSLQYTKDITQIISQSVMSMAVLGILGSNVL